MEHARDMTETERRMEWHKVCATIELARDYENWPDRLALSVIARLHDPKNFKGLLSFLEDEADAGRLATKSHEHQRAVRGRRSVTSAYLTRSPSEGRQLTPDRTQTTVSRSARAVDVAAVIPRKVIEQGRFLFAWLEPFLQAEVSQEKVAISRPKRETQADRIGNVATECERRAVELRLTFDRSKMPGTKADFLELVHALDADLRSIKTVESLDRYLKGAGCKWPLEAGKQPSAVPLYASLFPKAPIRAPGAVSPQRRKA
ncbi:hypothetical protein MASR2M16_31910 [Thauera terpenica]